MLIDYGAEWNPDKVIRERPMRDWLEEMNAKKG